VYKFQLLVVGLPLSSTCGKFIVFAVREKTMASGCGLNTTNSVEVN